MIKKIQFVAFLVCSISQLNAQVVTTFAGSGSIGSANGVESVASFYTPTGVALDAFGNVFVADFGNNLIRKITTSGVVSTLAGSGTSGSSNGLGALASFNYPAGVAVDASGNVYVADQNNLIVRKITPAGLVSTLAGSGTFGNSNGTGVAASFWNPYGVAVDGSGNVYVTDVDAIRMITPSGVVSTFAGSYASGSTNGTGTSARFAALYGITIDASGNLYVADTDNNLIRKISPSAVVTTLAGSGSQGYVDGIGTAASFNYPTGVAVDGSGNVYVADQHNQVIRKITSVGVVTTLAGSQGFPGSANGIGTAASFSDPSGVAVDALGNVYVADFLNSIIRKITMTTTAIEESTAISELKLYPIPVKQTLTLALTLESDSDLRFDLISMSGIKVASTEANYSAGFHELTLSVATLASGIYVANIYSNGQVKSQRVVVE